MHNQNITMAIGNPHLLAASRLGGISFVDTRVVIIDTARGPRPGAERGWSLKAEPVCEGESVQVQWSSLSERSAQHLWDEGRCCWKHRVSGGDGGREGRRRSQSSLPVMTGASISEVSRVPAETAALAELKNSHLGKVLFLPPDAE